MGAIHPSSETIRQSHSDTLFAAVRPSGAPRQASWLVPTVENLGMAEDIDDDEDRRAGVRPRGQPRFGSFVTITAAILLLFGAASRVGKAPEVSSLFNIDQAHESRVQGERLQEERLKTIITLGAVPAPVPSLRPNGGSLPIDSHVLPPRRPETDIDFLGGDQRLLSAPVLVPNGDGRTNGDDLRPPGRQDGGYGADDRDAPSRARPQSRTYVVANGDTWVKIAKNTLGDANRWKDLLNANPSAKDGLRVGMRLVIP